MQRKALRGSLFGTDTDFPVGRLTPGAAVTCSGKFITTDPQVGLYCENGDTPTSIQLASGEEALLKRPLDYLLTFSDPFTISNNTYCLGLDVWKNRRFILSQSLSSTAGWDLAVAAAGGFDVTYELCATNLLPYRNRLVSVRIGWEMNFNGGFPWSLGGAGSNQTPANYIASFQRLAGFFRKWMPEVLIDWCPLWDRSGVAWYPGDEWVDVISSDIYVNSAFFPDSWSNTYNAAAGPGWLDSFAGAHGKMIGVPEWATDYNTGTFITNMAAWMRRPRPGRVAYHSYWNSNASFTSALKGYPVNQAAYLAAFGA